MFHTKPVPENPTPEWFAERDADYVKRGLKPPPAPPEEKPDSKPQ